MNSIRKCLIMEACPWMYQGRKLDSPMVGFIGFVYLITAPNGMKYIGKKLFTSSRRRKPLKGTKRVRCDRVESDWESYMGSSKELLAELEKHGPRGWRREILHFAKSKWGLMYLELKEQLARDVIMRSDYYNGILHVRLRGQSPEFYKLNGFAEIAPPPPIPRRRRAGTVRVEGV